MPVHRWFGTEGVKVFDWYCPGDELRVGAEEEAPEWELSIGRTGSHAVRDAEGEHVVEPVHVLCVNAGDVFRPVRRILGLERRTCISFSAAGLRQLCRDEAPRFPRRAALLSPRAALLHHRLLRAAAAAERDELAVHTFALELAAHALGRAAPPPPVASRRLRDAIRAVQDQLVLRFAEPLTLSRLAADVELSPWHLSRAFSAQLGIGLHRYRTRLRLLSALERLRDRRRPDLSRVAFEVGFSSHSHFTREFRAFFGAPPSHFV